MSNPSHEQTIAPQKLFPEALRSNRLILSCNRVENFLVTSSVSLVPHLCSSHRSNSDENSSISQVPLTFCLSLSVSVSLSLSVFLSVSVSLSFSLCLCLSLSISVFSLSLPLPLFSSLLDLISNQNLSDLDGPEQRG
jgi:hypothetical protein